MVGAWFELRSRKRFQRRDAKDAQGTQKRPVRLRSTGANVRTHFLRAVRAQQEMEVPDREARSSCFPRVLCASLASPALKPAFSALTFARPIR
jgi:hypothetical protein